MDGKVCAVAVEGVGGVCECHVEAVGGGVSGRARGGGKYDGAEPFSPNVIMAGTVGF